MPSATATDTARKLAEKAPRALQGCKRLMKSSTRDQLYRAVELENEERLEDAFEAEGKKEWFEVLRPFVAGGSKTPLNQEQAAQKLGVPVATLRTWLWRLRQRYREAVRMEVASTVSDPSDVEQELHYLYEILSA